MILSKSCSRCGGSTVLEGQTVRKSVRRATPNGTGKKKRQKSLPAPSPDALFRSRARFLSILGSRPGPKIVPKPVPRLGFLNFGHKFLVFLMLPSLRCVPEGSRSDSGGSGDPPGPDFDKIFHKALRFFGPDSCRILQYFFDDCVGVLSGFAGVSPGSTSNLSNPLCGVPLGYGDLAQRFKFAVPHRGAGVVRRVPPGCCRGPHPTSVTHSAGFPWGTAIREAV